MSKQKQIEIYPKTGWGKPLSRMLLPFILVLVCWALRVLCKHPCQSYCLQLLSAKLATTCNNWYAQYQGLARQMKLRLGAHLLAG